MGAETCATGVIAALVPLLMPACVFFLKVTSITLVVINTDYKSLGPALYIDISSGSWETCIYSPM